MEEFPFREECYKIIGCSMEVHKTLGHGFLEPVYQEALALELAEADIPFMKENCSRRSMLQIMSALMKSL